MNKKDKQTIISQNQQPYLLILSLRYTKIKPLDNVSSNESLIIYFNTTGPNITLASQQLRQFLLSLVVTHYKAYCKVVQYLKPNIGYGFLFLRSSEL